MGGAERAERKRRQRAAQADRTGSVAAQPASTGPVAGGQKASRWKAIGVAAVALLALLVGIGLWLLNRDELGDLPGAVPVVAAGPTYPVDLRGTAVVTGPADAPVTIDVYEDFLCAGCGQFEQLYGRQLAEAAAAGTARIAYHPVAILDDYSKPPGYSTLAAGAAFCAAESGIFPGFHDSLFATQPHEGGPAWTSAQLQQLGRALGADEGFARCVQDGNQARVAAATAKARQDLSKLRPDGRFGTPTILVDGVFVDNNDPDWLDEALGTER